MLEIKQIRYLSSTLHLQLGHEIHMFKGCKTIRAFESNLRNWLDKKMYGKPSRPASFSYRIRIVNEFQPNEELHIMRLNQEGDETHCWTVKQA